MKMDQLAKIVSKEIRDVIKNKIEGIKLVMDDSNFMTLKAIIDGPKDTPFEGGRFTINLVFPNNYPNEPPRGYFKTKIFHPNVNINSGEICVDTLKKEWRPDLGLRHILITIRCLMIEPNPESALNEEAGKLLLESYEEFSKHARVITEVHAILPYKLNSANPSNTICSITSQDSKITLSGNLTKNMKPQKKQISAARMMLKRL